MRKFLDLLVFVAATLPAIAHSEDIYIDIPQNSSLTLGSGVNLLKPTEAIPSCFEVDEEKLDPPKGNLAFSTNITVAYSTEEVTRSVRKDLGVSGKYGNVSADLKSWQNSNSKGNVSTLYLMLESRATGSRISAKNIRPTALRANMLATGMASDIIKMCGSHLATTEHRGRKLRVIFDLSQADQATKQEVGMAFSARGKFAVFKASASVNYSAQIQQLAKSGKIRLIIDGIGQTPSKQSIEDLVKTQPDFNSVGNAISSLLANIDDKDSYVGYGLSIQPIKYFATAPTLNSNDNVNEALKKSNDYEDVLRSMRSILSENAAVVGLSDAESKDLTSQIAALSKLLSQLRDQSAACLGSKADEAACDDLNTAWAIKVRDVIRSSARLSEEPDRGLYLDTKFPIGGQATFLASFPGKTVALETVNILAGEQKTAIFSKRKGIIPPNTLPFASSFPLLASVGGLALFLDMHSKETNTKPASATFGCYGGYFGVASYMIPVDNNDLADDSICRSAQASLTPKMPTAVGYPIPFDNGAPIEPPRPVIMPEKYPPMTVALGMSPITLSLSFIDDAGRHTVYKLSNNLAASFAAVLGN